MGETERSRSRRRRRRRRRKRRRIRTGRSRRRRRRKKEENDGVESGLAGAQWDGRPPAPVFQLAEGVAWSLPPAVAGGCDGM